ncbi:dirigent protein 5-like [Pistacia vera]|uniref:dirigent protein 5-like n=1 Tax=Pistacia vera TaxID=55513 RepID=UPI0012637AB9|nr:dirigent protein 5-like [Pistacia vera]
MENIEASFPSIREELDKWAWKDIYNMDETGLFYQMQDDNSLATKQLEGQKQNKERITIVICCNGDGSNKLPLWVIVSPSALASRKSSKYPKPCKQFVLYYHDILFGRTRNILSNSTSYRITNATNYQFRSLIIFDDPITKDENLLSPPVAAAQGLSVYDMRTDYSTLFAFSLIFNSTEHKGTINIMGSDPLGAPTRDLSVVGGTGDFFMARGIVTFTTEAVESIEYFRIKMDIKLYECY